MITWTSKTGTYVSALMLKTNVYFPPSLLIVRDVKTISCGFCVNVFNNTEERSSFNMFVFYLEMGIHSMVSDSISQASRKNGNVGNELNLT